ncbi:MAG: agmatine deiminase family protein [Deltaproteobacteria bacterium]|nr:agmatine deiminase family protein [Deltaproteobacteria bacterium]
MTGYRMPAEWAPHDATWLAWPHNPDTWQGRQKFVFPIWIRMIKALHLHETVHLLVNEKGMEDEVHHRLEKADIDFRKVKLHRIPTNDCWMRDIGPTFVKSPPPFFKAGLVGWVFNSWGEKWPPWDQDALVSSRIAEMMRPLPFFRPGIVLEGGSIETNGEGLLLTTESCLLHPKRNPKLNRIGIEKILREHLGVEKILWLPAGAPQGDDTDGHIDNLARFVSEERLKIIPLPVPKPIPFNGSLLPASYANFYIANGIVLLPVFDDPKDQEVVQIFKKLFPDRRIVPIPSRDLVVGLGGIHCVTQQQPGC